jgi:ribosomal protein S18 acetylase RimI-like enzyme
MKIDKTAISLRRATERDLDTLIEYRIMFLKDSYGDPSPEVESRLKISLKKYFSAALKEGLYISWIAEYKDKPIGFSGMVFREQPGNFDIPNGKTGYILNIFTLPEYRKNGIASMLMSKLIEEGRARNLDRLELRATNDGEPVYRNIGFVEPHDLPMELDLRKL